VDEWGFSCGSVASRYLSLSFFRFGDCVARFLYEDIRAWREQRDVAGFLSAGPLGISMGF